MPANSTLKILVVDDEQTIAKYVTELLHVAGYRVLPLYSPDEALRDLNYIHFDLAVIGIIMPNLTGLALADRLREIVPDCRILLMDCGDTVEAAKSYRSDFHYLPTPFEKEELLFWIRQAAIGNEAESVSRPIIMNGVRTSN